MVSKIVYGLIRMAKAEVKRPPKPSLRNSFFYTITPNPHGPKLQVEWMTSAQADDLAYKNLIERLAQINKCLKSK